jgi:hypothetical protein
MKVPRGDKAVDGKRLGGSVSVAAQDIAELRSA